MITYQPFWETLKNSKESTYSLIHNHSISSATINRLRQNQPVSTSTINDLHYPELYPRRYPCLYTIWSGSDDTQYICQAQIYVPGIILNPPMDLPLLLCYTE